MRLKSWMLAFLSFTVIFGSVWISDALGYWQTEGSKQPSRISEGAFEGAPDPADIRGSYSFGDIENAFGIDAVVLAEAFGVDGAQAETFQVKSLESRYSTLAEQGVEIGTDSVRVFVALYAGLPYDSEAAFLPSSAVDILIRQGLVSEQVAQSLSLRAVELPEGLQGETVEPSQTESREDNETRALLIKGKTTFRDLLEAGVSQVEIERVIGGKMPNVLTSIRDYCSEQGLSFETVKTELQRLIDSN